MIIWWDWACAGLKGSSNNHGLSTRLKGSYHNQLYCGLSTVAKLRNTWMN